MKRLFLLLCAFVPLCLCAFVPPAAADLPACIDATCRITAPDGGRGSGCVFEISQGRVFVLTAAHVVEQADAVQCEFWTQGHQSAPLPGRVTQRSTAADAAIIALDAAQFAGRLPKVIPLAGQDWMARPGETLTSVGCANGSWSTGWKGHALRYQADSLRFLPVPADGRSGSAIFDADGTKIVGIVRARDEASGEGIATPVQGLYQQWRTSSSTTTRNCLAPPTVRCPLCQRVYAASQCPLQGGRPHCPQCTALCEPLLSRAAAQPVQYGPNGCDPNACGPNGCGPSGSGVGNYTKPEWPHLLPYRRREAGREQQTPQPGPVTPWPTLPGGPGLVPTPAPTVDLGPVIQRLDAIAAGQGEIISQLRSAGQPPAQTQPPAPLPSSEPAADPQARQGVDAALKAVEAVRAEAKQGFDQAGKTIAEVQKAAGEAGTAATGANALAADAKKLAGDLAVKHDKLSELIQQHGGLFERIEMRRQAVEEKLGENASKFAEVKEFTRSLVQDKLAQGAPGVLSLIGIGGVPALIVGVLAFLIIRDVRMKVTTGDPLMIEKALASFHGLREQISQGNLLSSLHEKIAAMSQPPPAAPPAAAAPPQPKSNP